MFARLSCPRAKQGADQHAGTGSSEENRRDGRHCPIDEGGTPVRATREDLPTSSAAVVREHPLEDRPDRCASGRRPSDARSSRRPARKTMAAVASSVPSAASRAERVRQNVRRRSTGVTSAKRPTAVTGPGRDRLGTQQGQGDAIGEAAFLGDQGAEPPGDLVEHHRGQGGGEAIAGAAPGFARQEAGPDARRRRSAGRAAARAGCAPRRRGTDRTAASASPRARSPASRDRARAPRCRR